MRQLLLPALALVSLAACGGGKTTTTTPPGNEVADTADTDTGGDSYGGWAYGGYGGEYGGDYYGGVGYGGYDQPYVPPPPTPPNLVGSWATACVGTAKPYRRIDHVYTDTRWDVRIGEFSDAACTKRTSEQHHGGTYAFGTESTVIAPAWDVTFTVDVREVTADDKASAKAIAKACGVKLKAKGTADVLAKGCSKLGITACAAEYDVVALDGDRLRLGVGDACAVEQRPAALDTTVDISYKWQAIGITECDALVAAIPRFMNCAAMPAEAKVGAFDGFRDMETQLRSQYSSSSDPVAVKATADACKQGLDGFNQALSSMGC